jgi:glycosyltransferase involved in cell wall biosynthesis/ADP-heptose:LPS heptosyltransferase/predicted TPR repeat methyltransferase
MVDATDNAERNCWCGGTLGLSVHPAYGECRVCGTHVLRVPPTAAELSRFYTVENYWRGHVVRVSGHPPIEQRAHSDFTDRIPVWYQLLAQYAPGAASLLEIGCAHGGFLHYCRERGIADVVGVEVDPATCEFARRRFHLPHVISGLFPAVTLPRRRFDVVAGFDVLEHFGDPVQALHAVADLLDDGGTFLFQTPCYRGEGQEWEQFRPQEHLFLFQEQNVRRLMEAAGLEVVEILPGLFRDDMFVIGRKGRPVERLLIVRTDAIGDNVLASALLAPLREKYPGARVSVACREDIAELYECCPLVEEVIGFDRLRAYQDEAYRNRLFARLKAVHADVALNAVYSREPLTDALTLGSEARRTIAFWGDSHNMPAQMLDEHNRLYSVLVPSPGAWKPELARYADLLTRLGIASPRPEPALWLTAADEEFARELMAVHGLQPQQTLMLSVGAQAEARIYPNYPQALARFCREHDFAVIAVGTRAERGLAQRVLEEIGVRALNLCGETTLRRTAALMKRCRLLVGAETGTAHMACALGVPNVVVLGGGHFGRFMPYSRHTTAACLPLDCYGCDWRCRHGRARCVQDLSPMVVARALEHALHKDSVKPALVIQGSSLWPSNGSAPAWGSFHRWLALETVEIIPVGEVPPGIEALWDAQRCRAEGREEEARSALWRAKWLAHAADGAQAQAITQAIAANGAGEQLAAQGASAQAREAFLQALRCHPGFHTAHNNLAVLAWQAGDTVAALRHLKAALELDPLDRTTVLNAAEILHETGALQQARACLERYLEREPDDEEACRLHARLGPVPETDEYLVSAIVSVYNAERFLRGCLEDLLAQTIASRIEIIVIDSASPQGEGAIVREFQQRHRNIRYLRTAKRESVYAAWNRAIRLARGKYLTSANADDRHRADALERLASVLEERPDIALVYADVAVTQNENERFDTARPSGYFRWPEHDPRLLFQVCYIGPQPMWRRALHSRYGAFDPEFRSAGDYEFWLRLVRTEKFLHLPEVLGLYLAHPGSIEHQDQTLSWEESEIARRRHWPAAWGPRPRQHPGFFQPAAEASPPDRPAGRIPLVSVIVPTHGRPALLQDALASLVAQDYDNWEAIVVNDGGPSVQAQALAADPAGRVRYLEHRRCFGPAAARNTALRLARGEIVCYLDDDDRLLPNHLSTVTRALSEPGVAFVYTDARVVVERIADGKRVALSQGTPYRRSHYSRDHLLVTNYIPINTWAHRWDCLAQAGFFDETLPSHEDWELLLRLARRFELRYVPQETVEVRVRDQSTDSVTSRSRPTCVAVYRQVYARTDDMASEEVRRQRDALLAELQRRLPAPLAQAAMRPDRAQPAAAESARCEAADYQRWIEKHGWREIDAQLGAERMLLKWRQHPRLHVVLESGIGAETRLADTLESLAQQLYGAWRVSVVAATAAPEGLLEPGASLQWLQVPAAESVDAISGIIASSEADWILVLQAGDRLEPQSLLIAADYINLHPVWSFLYSDEDRIDARGELSDPDFKPDFNLDLLRSTAYVGNLCLVRREVLMRAGGYASAGGAGNHDAALKVLDSEGEGAIGHIAQVLLHRHVANEASREIRTFEAGMRAAIERHLKRRGVAAEVADGLLPGTFRLQYHHATAPLVTIIIPTRDKLEYLRPCLDSLFDRTTYPHFEVILVDNRSEAEDTHEYYAFLAAQHPGRVRILSYPHPFNYSAMNNMAARDARGDYLLLLNNDTQVVQPVWLERLMAHAQRPEVGVVGPRLVFADGRLQHAGVVLGMDGVAEHPYIGDSLHDPGYRGRAQVDRNCSAVTGACLLIRKSVYEQVGGLDEEHLAVSYNDVDLCLKVREAGYKIVWTPFATLVHHGSRTQLETARSEQASARFRREREFMLARWLPQLASDPAHNPNLSLATPRPQAERYVDASWDVSFHDRPRILAFPLDAMGLGEHRVVAPLRALETAGLVQTAYVPCSDSQVLPRVPTVVELARLQPDVLYLQSTLHDVHIEALRQYKRFNQVFKVFDFEDLKTDVPLKNSRRHILFPEIKRRLREALSCCDRLTVTTEPLAEAYRHLIADIRVLPLRLERSRWGQLRSLRRQGKRPRVGWAGAQQHHADLEILIPVIEETAHEVDWVFFGMCLDALRPYVREVHEFVPFEQYPAKLASLNLDLAVAPLDYHPFNEAKTNLRLLEYGILGWPVVCTDIHPYRGAPVKLVPNDRRAWVEAIRERIYDLDAAEQEGERLRQWVHRHWMLEDHLDEWLQALLPEAEIRRLEGVPATVKNLARRRA